MSKKDFIRLADYLRHVTLSPEALRAILDFCKASNSRFDEDIFVGYMNGTCGPNGGKVKA